MGRVVHFEIHADEPARAAKFYGDVFGWEIQKWAGPMEYWLVTTGPDHAGGINGAILRRMGAAGVGSPTGYVCTTEVEHLDDTIAKAIAGGATLAMPKQVIPGVGTTAYAIDTEGNIFGMLEPERNTHLDAAG